MTIVELRRKARDGSPVHWPGMAIGQVIRVARDGSWADMEWATSWPDLDGGYSWRKRQPLDRLAEWMHFWPTDAASTTRRATLMVNAIDALDIAAIEREAVAAYAAKVLPFLRHGSTCALQAVRDNAPDDELCTCGLREAY